MHVCMYVHLSSFSSSSSSPDTIQRFILGVLRWVVRHIPGAGRLAPNAWKIEPLQPACMEVLRRLHRDINTTFDVGNKDHMDKLKFLWSLSYPGVAFPPKGTQSQLWKELGYQSDDPLRDFRGGGCLCLDNMIYLASRQPALFDRLRFRERHAPRVARTSNSDDDGDINPAAPADPPQESRRTPPPIPADLKGYYPFAAAAVNVTVSLAEIISIQHTPREAPSSVQAYALANLCSTTSDTNLNPGDGFHRVFCATMDLLDRKFAEAGATCMQFPTVIKEALKIVDKQLYSGFQSLETFEKSLQEA